MGMNTVLLILNDHLHRIEREPEFGAEVSRSIQSNGRLPITGQTQVISTSHADDHQIIVVHGNVGIEVSRFLTLSERWTMEEAFRAAINKRAKDGADR